jgi:hypothetical protein
MNLTIEVGREPRIRRCGHCGGLTHTTQGFVYRDGDAYAIYFATLFGTDHQQRADLAVGIGTWEEGNAGADLSAFMGVWSTPDEYRFSFADSSDSGWAGSTLLSHQLNADEARSHPRRDEFFEVAEIVIRDDPSARVHMDARPQTQTR